MAPDAIEKGRRNKLARGARETEIIDHWPKLIENFSFSPQEFYARVEKALEKRQVPGLKISRVDWKEGALLSARREYLRLARERLIFDVCAAPFGTGFFVSWWLGKKPARFGLIGLILIIVGVCAAIERAADPRFGWVAGFQRQAGFSPDTVTWILWLMILIGTIVLVAPLVEDLDGSLLRTPIVGWIYKRWFRRITLYRIDLTCMYRAAIHAAVCEVIDEITQSHPIRPLSDADRRPVLAALVPGGGTGRH